MTRLSELTSRFNRKEFLTLHEEISFDEYLEKCWEMPKLVRSAYQRMYDMIMDAGTSTYKRYRKTYTNYHFFEDSEIPVFSLDDSKDQFVKFIRGAAGGFGSEKRLLLLHGPVGSAKSTLCRLLKRGLERYSRIDRGIWYTFKWVNLPLDLSIKEEDSCPMNDEPLKLLTPKVVEPFLQDLNKRLIKTTEDKRQIYDLRLVGTLNPRCRFYLENLLTVYEGDLNKVLSDHIRVVRKLHSEADRVGIGTFAPKDEKNQDSTELTGDIAWDKISKYGSDSDPRCVVGDTIIATNRGFTKIGNLIETEFSDIFQPIELNVNNIGNCSEKAVDIYYGGKKEVFKVKTKMSYSITATSNHKLLSIDDDGNVVWRKVENLQLGDYIALVRGVSVFSESEYNFGDFDYKFYANEMNLPIFPTNMNSDLGFLFGLWIGDGHYHINEGFGLSAWYGSRTRDSRLVFNELFKKRFGLDLNEITHRRSLVCWLENIAGLKGNKHIPECVLKSTKDTIISCLKGLWFTGGNVRNNLGSNIANFVTCSEVLASQVHKLLLAFGIVSSLYRVKEYYEVRLYGKNVNLLCDLIPELKERFTTGEMENCDKNAPNIDTIPNIKTLLRQLLKTSKNKDDLIKKYYGNFHDKLKNGVSYKTVSEFLNVCEVDESNQDILIYLNRLLEMNYLWLPIQSIESEGNQDVFDLYVPDTNSYWADGFVSHNCFNFDGEFCVGSRGMVEWVEVLKLQKEFLYDLLGATQEQCIKPKKFSMIGIDTVLLGHTNNPEFKRLQEDIYMEAFRDRTVKVDVPYLLEISKERNIYEHDYGKTKVKQHIAPHTLEMAALWGVLTRLKDCEAVDDPVKLAKLYDGQSEPGWTEDRVREIREIRVGEGMDLGVSPRYIQDAISANLSDNHTYINPFMLINELERRLRHSSLFAADKDLLKHYLDCIDSVKKELDEILKNEVKNALIADEDAIVRLCANYIDNLMAYIEGSKVTNEFTGREEEPNESLMRSIEEKIRIPDTGAHDFRMMIQGYIGKCHHEGKEFNWKANTDLRRALEAKLYEDVKDHIKLSALNLKGASTVDPDLQEKIDIIKKRMIEKFGYIEESATDVLNYVGSIYARGELAKEED